MSPVPVRTQQRYDASRKFIPGCRMVRKDGTGGFYIRGKYASARDVWVMQINPGKKGLVSWGVLLREFELE